MPENYDEKLLPEAKRVYGVKKLPHKFCPYCGTKNEAQNENCENCGKDISWIKIPEPSVRTESLPVEKVKKPQKEKPPSKMRIILLIAAIVIAILIAILVIILATTKSSGMGISLLLLTGCMFVSGSSLSKRAGRKSDTFSAEAPAASGVVIEPHLVFDPRYVELIDKGSLPGGTSG